MCPKLGIFKCTDTEVANPFQLRIKMILSNQPGNLKLYTLLNEENFIGRKLSGREKEQINQEILSVHIWYSD